MATTTPNRRLADLLLNGTLDEFVSTRRNRGDSWRVIARDLYDSTGHEIDVTHETLRQWFTEAET